MKHPDFFRALRMFFTQRNEPPILPH
jgi:hypothetical protein